MIEVAIERCPKPEHYTVSFRKNGTMVKQLPCLDLGDLYMLPHQQPEWAWCAHDADRKEFLQGYIAALLAETDQVLRDLGLELAR